MKSKLATLLLFSAPLIAQDAVLPADHTISAIEESTAQGESVAPVASELTAQAEPEKDLSPTCISVEFKLTKTDDSLDKETWRSFKKMLIDCHALAKDRRFEQAMALFNQFATAKPAGIMGNITINADRQITRSAEQAGVAPLSEKKGKGACTKVMCEIYKTDVSEDVWKEVNALAFEVIKSQQEVTYEKARDVAFAIIAKS